MNRKLSFFSKALNQETQYGIVVPEREADRLLILLPGYNGTFQQLMDGLPLENYAMKYGMLIVIPELDNGYFIDHPERDYFVGEYIAHELPEQVKEELHIKEKLTMDIAGISMGGYGSLLVATHYPTCFRAAISVSGAFIAHGVSIGDPSIVGMDSKGKVYQYFIDTFGPDLELLNQSVEKNPLAALATLSEEGKKPIFQLCCGTLDQLYPYNLEAVNILEEQGFVYDFFEIEGGKHDFATASTAFQYAFEWLEGR